MLRSSLFAILIVAGSATAQQPGAPPVTAPEPGSAVTATGRLPNVYSGLAGQTTIAIPRIDQTIQADGMLDEPVWGQAALLTGFSQFQPSDGRPADDSTHVLIWYSATAIHFGITAFEAHGAVHATLADRDKINADDFVLLLLDTFDDQRQALVFGVNPLGVQSDGTLTERTAAKLEIGQRAARDTVDLSADFTYQSRGRLTEGGYQVEVRVPFKSLRYQPERVQSWGVNVIRRVQHSGYEDTWTPTRRASASFLAQSGKLNGLTELHRGLVLDLNPSITARADGAPGTSGWDYDADRPEVGGNVRWGITNNLTLNGTANPDFSQIEADVGQVQYDPRNAVFFPEKRPFFLDGSEQFETPNQLIYTRRIVSPRAALKLSGKLSGTNFGLLTAVDDRATSTTGTDRPIYNLLRLRRDLAGQSTVGMVYTDRIDGNEYNRVAGADARFVFSGIYALGLQGAGAFTRRSGTTNSGPLWQAAFDRNGRTFGLHYFAVGFHPDFEAGSGFIERGNIVHANLSHQFTRYGKPGAGVESWSHGIVLDGIWPYRRFFGSFEPLEVKFHNNTTFTLKGGWRIGASLLIEQFRYDSTLYAGYRIERRLAGGVRDTVPFTGQPHLNNFDLLLNLATPQFPRFSASLFAIAGYDDNFFEWAPAWIAFVTLNGDWRPTDKLRVSARYAHQHYIRATDGTTAGVRRLPRLKLEYQLARPIFLRIVGQYDAFTRDSLRDDGRTDFPILLYDSATNSYSRAGRVTRNDFRVDWLFSFQPNPGTVIFAGYGSSLTEPDALKFRELRRVGDGFFVKLSYLWRL